MKTVTKKTTKTESKTADTKKAKVAAKAEPVKKAKAAPPSEPEIDDDEVEIKAPRISMEEASGLSKKQLDFLMGKLQEERTRVRDSIERHVAEATLDSEVVLPDEFDQASRHSDQAYLLRLADKERKLLMEVEHAIKKYEHGTFGVCEGTGEPIGYRRLEARPWARHSIEFKERLEREQGSRA
jgi:DnaK suppressor protein